jgi:16S rRNA (uracil1498-N3)-methyltransferase
MRRAPRFFVEGVRTSGERVDIRGGDAHKIRHVLRLDSGDELELIDSGGTLFRADIETIGETIAARLLDTIGENDAAMPALRVDVAQAIPKGQKMDFVVEKCTELGAGAILPFSSERTVASSAGDAKIERWRRLARTAAQQCGRREVPSVGSPLSFEGLLECFEGYGVVLFPWELAPHEPLLERLPLLLSRRHCALIVIGPEGGFTHEEAERAQACGASLLWLGPRILRTETAALALLAVVGALVKL